MSDGGGATMGTSTGHGSGGGFTQSPDAFSGLTNTDLRGRRRRRIALLNTSWLAGPRRKGDHMRKTLTDMVGTLEQSVIEIAASPAENREELLKQSFGEFNTALAEETAPPQDTLAPLEKSINHVAVFANTLRDANRTVMALITGKPSWIAGNDSNGETEILPAHLADELERWIDNGAIVLRAMVNDLAELPGDEEDLERAEQLGTLVKIQAIDGSDLLVKSNLPVDYHEFLADPAELMVAYADTARSYVNSALALAAPLLKADLLPPEVIAEYDELFESDLHKARDETFGDETVGDGASPDAAADPGADAGEGDDITDGMPQDPLALLAKLASIQMVIIQSLQQAAGAGGAPDDGQDDGAMDDGADDGQDDGQTAPDNTTAGIPDDTTARKLPPLRRSAPALDAPLAKADADELAALRKRNQDHEDELAKLKATVSRLEKMPAAPKGRVYVLDKNEDAGVKTIDGEAEAVRIAKIADADPDAAARELLKMVHSGGGRPILGGS